MMLKKILGPQYTMLLTQAKQSVLILAKVVQRKFKENAGKQCVAIVYRKRKRTIKNELKNWRWKLKTRNKLGWKMLENIRKEDKQKKLLLKTMKTKFNLNNLVAATL